MKHTFLSLKAAALILLLSTLNVENAHAQNKTWSAGPEAGLSLSKLAGDLNNQDLKSGFVSGGHVTYSTRSNFGLTLKALYHQRGSQQDINNVTNKTSLNYLEVPLFARYFLTTSGKFRPNVFIGPSAGFLFGVKKKAGEGDYVNVSAQERDNFFGVDLSLSAGFGLNYLIAKETRLLFDSRYVYGLSDVYRPIDKTWNNRGLAFTLGVSFGLNKQPLK